MLKLGKSSSRWFYPNKRDWKFLQKIFFSPGRGGTGKNWYSGGGGGVLVNGESNDCNCVHAGEGFGGGGGYGCPNKNGAIIFDFCNLVPCKFYN